MKLNERSLANRSQWLEHGFELPEYNRAEMRARTRKNPMWLHFGAGNLFRAFPALCQQWLLNAGLSDRGIIIADNADMVEKNFRQHNELSLTVTLCPDGSIEKVVVGSIAEAVSRLEDSVRLCEIFCSPSLQMVSFTITEKGYRLKDSSGKYVEDVEHDMLAGPSFSISYMGRLVAMLYQRYCKGATPLALVSMDNCSHNGEMLRNAFVSFAEAWVKSGACEQGFLDYVSDERCVAFPWSMIDKITPRPDAQVREMLLRDKFDDVAGFVTKRGTYVAPYGARGRGEIPVRIF